MARPFEVRVPSRNVVDLEPVAASLFGEEEHRVVHRGHIDVFDEVFVACGARLDAHAAPVLRPVFGQRSALDIAHVRNGDDHLVVGIEIFRIELFGTHDDFRAAFVAVLLLYLQRFVLDDA